MAGRLILKAQGALREQKGKVCGVNNDEERPSGQPERRRGLRLRVLRPADGIDRSNGGVSSKHEFLTLVGTVDQGTASQPPSFNPLPEEYQSEPAMPDAPPVWLAENRTSSGAFYVIPGNEDTGEPLLRSRTDGGNYVTGIDPEFGIMVSTAYPIPVRDKVPVTPTKDNQ